ncbi:MAG: hypothetical protein REI78_13315 [Pedobacter sp.]|nr:hypothetical protein [Pedobacter sp.]MDQ8054007.1 hypothetical protein [Pedobacter sp.]
MKKSKLRPILVGLLALAMVAGCKKDNKSNDLTDEQQIQQAKTWFTNQQKSQATSFKDRKGKTVQLTYVPDWEHANVEVIDGRTVVTADVKTNLQAVYGENTYFSLVIKNEENGYEARTLKISSFDGKNKKDLLNREQLYKAAYTDEDLSKDGVEAEVKAYDAHLKSNGAVLYTASGKTMINDQPSSDWRPYTLANIYGKQTLTTNILPKTMQTYCYDAYMVTRVYEDGVLIDIYQEFMGFQICREIDSEYLNPTDLNGVGGALDPPVEENAVYINWGEAIDVDISTTVIDDTTRHVAWYCYTAESGALKYKSYETIKASRWKSGWYGFWTVGYTIKGVYHNTILPEGTLTDQDSTPMLVYAEDQTGLTQRPKIYLVFKDKRSYMDNGQHKIRYSKDYPAWKSWAKESLGWQDREEH